MVTLDSAQTRSYAFNPCTGSLVIIWTVHRLLQVVTIDIHFHANGEVKISWLDVVLNAEGMPRLELRPMSHENHDILFIFFTRKNLFIKARVAQLASA